MAFISDNLKTSLSETPSVWRELLLRDIELLQRGSRIQAYFRGRDAMQEQKDTWVLDLNVYI